MTPRIEDRGLRIEDGRRIENGGMVADHLIPVRAILYPPISILHSQLSLATSIP